MIYCHSKNRDLHQDIFSWMFPTAEVSKISHWADAVPEVPGCECFCDRLSITSFTWPFRLAFHVIGLHSFWQFICNRNLHFILSDFQLK